MKYTVSQFRKETRKILDMVDGGADVQLIRYDKMYTIVRSTGERLKPGSVIEVSGDQLKLAKKGNLDPDTLCPHGFAKGNCKKEDCNKRYRK